MLVAHGTSADPRRRQIVAMRSAGTTLRGVSHAMSPFMAEVGDDDHARKQFTHQDIITKPTALLHPYLMPLW